MPSSKQTLAARKADRVWISTREGGYWYAKGLPEDRHGVTNNGYSNWYCRCPPCCQANTDKWHNWYHRKVGDIDHTDAADLREVEL